MGSRVDALLGMLERGQDTALLRFSLGSEYLAAEDPAAASTHLERAVELDPAYSAAWKLLGRALTLAGRRDEAGNAYRQGIRVAEDKGDAQAAKEMRVFLRRLDRQADGNDG